VSTSPASRIARVSKLKRKHGNDVAQWPGVKGSEVEWGEKEDERVIEVVNKMVTKGEFKNLTVWDYHTSLKDLTVGSLSFLAPFQSLLFRYRLSVLLSFNKSLSLIIPLLDLTDRDPLSLSGLLRVKGKLVGLKWKEEKLKEGLDETKGEGGNGVTVILDNYLASKSQGKKQSLKESKCIFVQAYQSLSPRPSHILRSVWDGDRVFQVSFRGEVRRREERRTAGGKRQLEQYLTYLPLASIATPLLVASLLAHRSPAPMLGASSGKVCRGSSRTFTMTKSTSSSRALTLSTIST